MTAYNVALFVHLLGVIALFGAFVLLQRAGGHLRAAETVEQVRVWADLARSTTGMLIGGAVMLLLSGMFMLADTWGSMPPWAAVALVGLVAITVLHAVVNRPHFARVGVAAAAAADGPLPPELARLIATPLSWALVFSMNGVALGSLWLMATKLDWIGSIVSVVILGALGAAIGTVVVRPRGRPSPAIHPGGAEV
jgi:hypothetical protein